MNRGEVCKRSNFTYTLMFSVPNPKLGDAGDIVVTESSEGRQTWHQTRMTAVVMGETLAEGTGPGWGSHGRPTKASFRRDRWAGREGFLRKRRTPDPRPQLRNEG